MSSLIPGLIHITRLKQALRVVMVGLLAAGPLVACGDSEPPAATTAPPALSGTIAAPPSPAPTNADFGALPGRASATPPDSVHPTAPPTAPITPLVTSPFTFPTSPPDNPTTPARDCTSVYPLENVESISFGQTTVPQLEASFGHAEAVNGRPPRFRFEEDGCTLLVTVGTDEALEAELDDYGTLGLLLDRYGPPAAAGIAQGNLTLMLFGNAVLLYPERGIIAIFEVGPDNLTRDTPVMSLQFRPAYLVEKQIARLNLETVTWQPPQPPPGR